jgi:hypothetical protein
MHGEELAENEQGIRRALFREKRRGSRRRWLGEGRLAGAS